MGPRENGKREIKELKIDNAFKDFAINYKITYKGVEGNGWLLGEKYRFLFFFKMSGNNSVTVF